MCDTVNAFSAPLAGILKRNVGRPRADIDRQAGLRTETSCEGADSTAHVRREANLICISVSYLARRVWNAQSFEGKRSVVGRGWLPFRPRVAFHVPPGPNVVRPYCAPFTRTFL